MDVQYERLKKDPSRGEYLVDLSKERHVDNIFQRLLVHHKEDVPPFQERIIAIADLLAGHLQAYALPEGIGGKAEIYFSWYSIDRQRRWRSPKLVGLLACPNAKIETGLGTSALHFWPENTVLHAVIQGGGLAEKVLKETWKEIDEMLYAGRPSTVEWEDLLGSRDILDRSSSSQLSFPLSMELYRNVHFESPAPSERT